MRTFYLSVGRIVASKDAPPVFIYRGKTLSLDFAYTVNRRQEVDRAIKQLTGPEPPEIEVARKLLAERRQQGEREER